MPYCSADSSRLLILPLVNGFKDGLQAVLHCRWQRIAPTSAHQRLFQRVVCRIALQTGAYCSFFRSPTAFTTVCMPYCLADGVGLLKLLLANCFHDDLRAADCSLYRSFFRSSTSIIHDRFAYHIPHRMAADYSFFRLSMAFTTVCTPYCSADGSGLLIPPLINGFHNSLRAVLLYGWQRIAHTSAHQRLSQQFARCIALRMAADCSTFLLPTAFTMVCTPYSLVDGIGLPPPLLANGFHDDWRAVLLRGWHRIGHTSASQRLSRRFTRHIAQRMVSDCLCLCLSTAFTTVCAPYCSADGSGLLNLPLANSLHDGLRAILLSGWYRIAPTSAR